MRSRRHEGTSREGRRRFLRETLLPILATIAVVVPLRSAVADWNDVPSGSMRPTILEGDRIWVNKLAYGLRWPLTEKWIARWDAPARGDVVTLASPEDGTRLVKRIVGLPGDRISMRANRLTINGEAVEYAGLRERPVRKTDTNLGRERLGERWHAITLTPALAGRIDSFDEFTVPDGHYFFLGDNRDRSGDARLLGPVSRDAIHGRVSHIALSVDPDRHYRPRFERWGRRLDSPEASP